MAAPAEMKRPTTAYFLWFNENREDIQKQLGTKNLGEVGKKGGEMWRALSAAAKQPFETKAKEQKDAFEKFKATDAGKKALEEKKAEKQENKESKVKRDAKRAVKAIEKDDKLKKPATAYFLFTNAKREEVQKLLGCKDLGPVATKISEMWKALTDAGRKPFLNEAQKQKDDYEKYIKSAEGAAALKAYKDEVKEAKANVKGKRAANGDAPDAKKAKTAGA